MPVHDWTRVKAGVFHDFHQAWILHLKEALNAGLLPPAYYALGEQRSADISPDLLTLHVEDEDDDAGDESAASSSDGENGMIAVAEAPPRVRLAQEAASEAAFYLAKRRSLVIRHTSGDR